MTIGGLQKLTLLDFPSRTACTVFLAGCNLCCPYCHNPGLVVPDETAESLPEGELLRFLSSRIGKLDGVCVSGGEPTIHPELPALLSMIRELGFQVKLDTNGTNPRMKSHPTTSFSYVSPVSKLLTTMSASLPSGLPFSSHTRSTASDKNCLYSAGVPMR